MTEQNTPAARIAFTRPRRSFGGSLWPRRSSCSSPCSRAPADPSPWPAPATSSRPQPASRWSGRRDFITYYTDQGDLSPILPNASANAFVADAFSQWTSVPTAAVAAVNGGQLAEDVNGSNVTNSGGTLSMPTDIQPTATGTPIGIVYDYDGSVTSALLGSGAGDASQCFFNAAYGGDDNYAPPATYIHALVVINGQCAQQSSQLVDVEYRLVRVLGTVFGVGWSQVNPNVLTNSPPPTASDFAGFPLMHYSDPVGCVPITRCYANPYRLSPDDIAAISRLYPVTPQNQSNFPGKQMLTAATARIHGSVWFTDASGNPTQPMQGVNVVARWIDPATNLPSRQYVASSVSGFLFTGNFGNPITGFTDALGNPLSDWGSTAPALRRLLRPRRTAAAQRRERAISTDRGTGRSDMVGRSRLLRALAGRALRHGAADRRDRGGRSGSVARHPHVGQRATSRAVGWPRNLDATAPVPAAGNWAGSLNGYGDVSYFLLARAG